MTRVVLDTNVYVSALVFGGKPLAVLQLAETGAFQLVVSAAIKAELHETLTEKFGWPAQHAERACRELWNSAHWVTPPREVRAARGPDDDPILACALEGQSQAIITGDQDLLVLHPFRGVAIITPAEFLARELTP
jgi:hypothetical protein